MKLTMVLLLFFGGGGEGDKVHYGLSENGELEKKSLLKGSTDYLAIAS